MGKENSALKFLSQFNDIDNSHLGTLFKTDDNIYFYDTGTGKVCACGDKEAKVLELLLQGKSEEIKQLDNLEYFKTYENILALIETEQMLKHSTISKFSEIDDLEILVKNNLEHIVLELTEQCNLHCKYCIYDEYSDYFRNFSLKKMSIEIAEKAIDYGLSHCGDELIVGFYGGEPLLEKELLKNIIKYIDEKNINHKTITYSLTTNLTLMTKEMAEFLASLKKCYITCSIDGPQEIQDLYRTKKDNKGSFETVIKGLKNLIDAYGEKASEFINIYSVVSPPYTRQKMYEISNFFENLEWLPKEVNCSYTKVKEGTLPLEATNNNNFDEIKEWMIEELLKTDDINCYAVKCEKSDLMKIHNRMLIDHPIQEIPMNGCCVPGKRRIYVTVKGKFLICEKMGKSPEVGDVHKGININVLKEEYISKYKKESQKKCRHCWACYLCPICYSSCYTEEGIDSLSKEKLCNSAKDRVKESLIKYHTILERNPELLLKIINSAQ